MIHDKYSLKFIAAMLVAAAISFSTMAWAEKGGKGKQGGKKKPQAAQVDSTVGALNYDDIARRIQKSHGGKVLSVDPADDKDHQLRVKLFDEGTVRILVIDPLDLP